MAKNYKLAQAADKDKVYGALKEFIKNKQFWHTSMVGREYCHLTDEGREILPDMIQDMLRTIDALEKKVVEQQAKEVVWDELTDTKDKK